MTRLIYDEKPEKNSGFCLIMYESRVSTKNDRNPNVLSSIQEAVVHSDSDL